MPNLDMTNRPHPKSREDQARWGYTALVHRMLSGLWEEDARDRLQSLFDRSVWPSLAPPETSRNALLSIVSQKAIMYDEPPVVAVSRDDAGDDVDLSPVERPELWPLMQQTLRFVVGMNECLMRVDWREGVGITYRLVTPDSVVAVADTNRPDVPARVEELRWRREHGWTWEVWDVRDPSQPVFRVEKEDEDGRVDVTSEVLGESAGEFPYRDRSGQPIMPYVLYHSRVGNRLWDPYHGSEVVHGTLTAAALWTMWITGVRDGAHPQRVVIDGDIGGGSVNAGSSAGASKGVRSIALTQTAILPVLSRGQDRQASIDQWAPAMEPESAAKSLESFETGLAIHAGISPADVTRGSANQSGYSIVVSRDGQRQAQKRLEPPMRMGDTLMLATAARMHNSMAGGDLPESPDDYSVTYHRPKQSPDEIRSAIEGAKSLLDSLLITPADAYRQFHPGATDEQAIEAMINSAQQKRMVASATMPAPEPEPTPEPEEDDTTNPDDSEPEEDE